MFHLKYKSPKAVILILIILLAGMVAVFVYTKNQQKPSEELPQGQNVLVLVGDVEQMQLTLDNGDKVSMFIQAYTLRDMNGNMIDLSNVQTVKIKYPGGERFLETPFSAMPDGAMFKLAIWPPDRVGEYIFRIEYEDGTIRKDPLETVFDWKGPTELKSTPIASKERIGEDGTREQAYTVEGLDISSFDTMYYMRGDNSVARIFPEGSEYLWIPMKIRGSNQVVLIKKDGQWYYTKIFYSIGDQI